MPMPGLMQDPRFWLQGQIGPGQGLINARMAAQGVTPPPGAPTPAAAGRTLIEDPTYRLPDGSFGVSDPATGDWVTRGPGDTIMPLPGLVDDAGGGGAFRKGGKIPSDGDRKLEARKVTAHEGEFVIRPEAAQMYGPEVMNAINQGLLDPAALAQMIKMPKMRGR